MKTNFREILNNRNWEAEAPASEEAIEQLLQRSKLPLPGDYLDFLRYSIGGQGFLTVQPRLFSLWPAEQTVDNNLDYQMPDYVPGFFGFGDDGGDEFFAFDTRTAVPWKIYTIPFVPMEERYALYVAEDFLSLVNYIE
jgi:hypothetical protein